MAHPKRQNDRPDYGYVPEQSVVASIVDSLLKRPQTVHQQFEALKHAAKNGELAANFHNNEER